MSRSVLRSMCRHCQTRLLTNSISSTTKSNNITRSFSSTARFAQDIDKLDLFEQAIRKTSPQHPSPQNPNPSTRPTAPSFRGQNTPPTTPTTPTTSTSTSTSTSANRDTEPRTNLDNLAAEARNEASTRPSSAVSEDEPYHITIYAHKHNMHITFTEPSRNPIISYSAGNIGLRKAQRGSFDAAYQLSTYTMRKIAEKQWRIGGKAMVANKMMTLNEQEVRDRGIELIFRGYGPGREAFQKALLGNEGKILKPLVKKVTDSTRLKFGGTRSPQVRRLG